MNATPQSQTETKPPFIRKSSSTPPKSPAPTRPNPLFDCVTACELHQGADLPFYVFHFDREKIAEMRLTTMPTISFGKVFDAVRRCLEPHREELFGAHDVNMEFARINTVDMPVIFLRNTQQVLVDPLFNLRNPVAQVCGEGSFSLYHFACTRDYTRTRRQNTIKPTKPSWRLF